MPTASYRAYRRSLKPFCFNRHVYPYMTTYKIGCTPWQGAEPPLAARERATIAGGGGKATALFQNIRLIRRE